MKLLVTASLLIASVLPIKADIAGSWHGKLSVGPTAITLVFNIDNTGDAPSCTLDSPDQGVRGIPADINFISADSLNVTVPALGVAYSARLDNDKLKGSFTQRGFKAALTLTAGKPAVNRPQTPVEPFPYATEEVTFTNPGDGAVLSGTVSYPMLRRENAPVVVMISGSGLQNRDEELMDHKPFAVLADYLAKNGIASLRYDDRGAGKSTGDLDTATTYTFMLDALAAVDFCRKNPHFVKVGVIGHSEGGRITFMLGSRDAIDFGVTLGAPGVRGDSILLHQNRLALSLAGDNTKSDDEIMALIRQAAQTDKANAWITYFMDDDPTADIKATRCPLLVINGEKDTQVPADRNLEAIRRNLPRNEHTIVWSPSGLNHLMQHCTTGLSNEYAQIEETMSPDVLKRIAEWINSLPK